MSFRDLDVEQQLRWLQETRQLWARKKEGEVYLYPDKKLWLIEVGFRVLHYRVLLSVIVGTRGGVTEQVTVVDDRPKETELDHLFLVQATEGSSKYSSGLITYKIGHGTRPEKMQRIKPLLEEEYRTAIADPPAYAHRIEVFESTTSESHFSGMLRAELPRT